MPFGSTGIKDQLKVNILIQGPYAPPPPVVLADKHNIKFTHIKRDEKQDLYPTKKIPGSVAYLI